MQPFYRHHLSILKVRYRQIVSFFSVVAPFFSDGGVIFSVVAPFYTEAGVIFFVVAPFYTEAGVIFFAIAPFCTGGDVIYSAAAPFFPESGEGCTPVRGVGFRCMSKKTKPRLLRQGFANRNIHYLNVKA